MAVCFSLTSRLAGSRTEFLIQKRVLKNTAVSISREQPNICISIFKHFPFLRIHELRGSFEMFLYQQCVKAFPISGAFVVTSGLFVSVGGLLAVMFCLQSSSAEQGTCSD